MLGEHPSSLTELHAQKHQVNSPCKSQHHFWLFPTSPKHPMHGRLLVIELKPKLPKLTCVTVALSCIIHHHVVFTHEWHDTSIHPNLFLSNLETADASSDFSLFEALRETIYSEVATLISQNESRPHFLIELFHELQLLNTDYLRQRALYSLQVSSD